MFYVQTQESSSWEIEVPHSQITMSDLDVSLTVCETLPLLSQQDLTEIPISESLTGSNSSQEEYNHPRLPEPCTGVREVCLFSNAVNVLCKIT